MGALSNRVEADKGCDHKGGRISISLQRGAKRACDICLPDNSEEEKLFIQAPTGVGKTMTTIFPAVKAVGEGLGDKIFYLTAKTITRTVAEQAFQILKRTVCSIKLQH